MILTRTLPTVTEDDTSLDRKKRVGVASILLIENTRLETDKELCERSKPKVLRSKRSEKSIRDREE